MIGDALSVITEVVLSLLGELVVYFGELAQLAAVFVLGYLDEVVGDSFDSHLLV